MKRFWIIVLLLVALAQTSPGLYAAATSRGFTSTQTLKTPGGGPGALWFSQPLQTNSVQKASAKQEKGVKNVPPPPTPKKKTAKDNRNIYDKTTTDSRKVEAKSKRDDKATQVKPKTVKSSFDQPSYDATSKAPNSGVRTLSNEPGVFSPMPPPKKRKHGLGDWP